MSSKTRPQMSEKAAKRFTQSQRNDDAFLQQRRKQEAANLEKTMRLRTLRLEKEAAARKVGDETR
jgi:hypothetical protein